MIYDPTPYATEKETRCGRRVDDCSGLDNMAVRGINKGVERNQVKFPSRTMISCLVPLVGGSLPR